MNTQEEPQRKSFNPWHFTWISVIVSELFTAILSTLQHYFSPGEVELSYLLQVGAIDALFVPLIIVPVIIYYSRRTDELNRINAQLQREVAERRRTEVALQAQEERLRLAMETTRQEWFDLNVQTGKGSVSPEYTRLLGFEPGEFSMDLDDWKKGIHPGDRDYVLKAFGKILEHGESRTMEYRQRTKTDEWIWIRSTGKVVEYDVDNRPMRIIGTHADISERKKAEEALRTSEVLLHAVVESSADAIFVKDLRGRYILMNKAGSALHGKPVNEIIGRDDRDLFPLAEAARIIADDENIIRSASSVMYEHSLTLSGTERVLQVRKGPVFDDQHKVKGVYGISRDITERRQIEDALRSSETRFRTIIENASAGIMVADVETKRIRYANPAICRMLGYHEQDFLTMAITDMAMPGELPSVNAGFQDHARGIMNASERTFRKKDGTAIRMAINSIPMVIDGVPCLVGFFTDISEKHLLEQERLKTQKLEAIGTLAGGIAHDFNNLLQGVFGYISLAKLTADDREKSMSSLDQAEKALHLSVKLTNQLLTFSKGGKPVKKVIDIPPVIETAAQFALSGSRSNYRMVVADGLWQTEADEGQIGQVVQNVVLNADQAMPEGGQVEILVKNIESPGDGLPQGLAQGRHLAISISDRGIGMPEHYLTKIFDPYFTTKEKGSGLGLATAYSIIKNHSGLIDVSSTMGKGTIFVVYLPAIGPVQKPAQPEQAAAAEARACRILVMDDEQIVRDIAGEMLLALGHNVEFAVHGEEAVEKYETAMRSGKPFELVILDLTIRGGMGGAETIRRLRMADPEIKAIVSSGYSHDAITSNYRAQGFKAFLNKPYTVEALREVLGSLLNNT